MKQLASNLKSRISPRSYLLREIGLNPHDNARTWVSVNCPFHSDQHPSMSVHLDSGRFCCHACGAKGGSIIAFEMQRYDLSFRDAVQKLSQEWGIS